VHPLLGDLGARGSRAALVTDGQAVSFAELERAARAHAAALASEGLGAGDRVAVWATPRLQTVAAIVGNALLGVATVPLNPAIGDGELRHVLADAAPRLVLAADPAPFRARTPSVTAVDLSGEAGPLPPPPAPTDPLYVVYTSGTTGAPKGAGITHRAAAFDLDAQWGKVGDEGLFALAEYLQGDDATAAKPEMRGFQALAAYNIRMKSPTAWLYAVEPSFRFDLADPDSDTDSDRVTTMTAALGVYFSSRAWFRVGYERENFQDDITPSISGVRSMLAVNF
jgi:hypothetical protein